MAFLDSIRTPSMVANLLIVEYWAITPLFAASEGVPEHDNFAYN
jgi:hypothetical protein